MSKKRDYAHVKAQKREKSGIFTHVRYVEVQITLKGIIFSVGSAFG